MLDESRLLKFYENFPVYKNYKGFSDKLSYNHLQCLFFPQNFDMSKFFECLGSGQKFQLVKIWSEDE